MFIRFAAIAARCALASILATIGAAVAAPLAPPEVAKLCAEAEGTAHCGRLIEEVQLKRLPNLAVREGTSLKILLYPSGAMAFADTESLHGGRSFSLWDYLSEINAVVLYVTNGDDVSFLLLQRATGRSVELPAEPKVSPDRARLVTADFCATHCVNEVAIWRVTRDAVRKELDWKPRETWSDATATWTSATSVAIEYTLAGAEKSTRLERRLADSDWVASTPP